MSFIPTDEQKLVIEHFGSPLRVLAGPGTGKTTSITRRIQHLISVRKVPYTNICAITFTRAATGEMRKKLEHECGIRSDELPRVSTLHALATNLLRRYHALVGLHSDFHTPSESEKRLLLADVTEDMAVRGVRLPFRGFPKTAHYLEAYDQERSCGKLPDWITKDAQKKRNYDLFVQRYQEVLRFYRAVDWTDVIVRTVQLLKEHAAPRSELQTAVQQLLVDEYQDFNPLEQDLVASIVNSHDGLCVVGDDDQSIFETFRFANPAGIIDFTLRYGGAQTFPLTVSNRCPPKLIEKALRVIECNTKRAPKTLKPRDPNKIGDAAIFRFPSKKKEIVWIVQKIKELVTKGHAYRDMLILFSDGRVAQDYITALRQAGIPHDVQLKVRSICDSLEFALLLATLRTLINANDNFAVRECLEQWPSIGPKTIRQLRQMAEAGDGSMWSAVEAVGKNLKGYPVIRQRSIVVGFYRHVEQLRAFVTTYSALCDEFLRQNPACAGDEGCQALIRHLRDLAGQEQFLNLADALQQFDQKKEQGDFDCVRESDEVRIMTMHSAKGCEAPFVFIPALEEDIMPGTSPRNLEEQRRLFYVSLTRAKVFAYLSWAYQRTGPEIHRPGGTNIGRRRSRFLDEMDLARKGN